MAISEDLWRKLNSVASETGSWMDAVKQASLRWLFPAIDVVHTFYDLSPGVSTQILGERRGRRRFTIIENDGTTTMYVNFNGGPAVVNEGIRINSNGGNLLVDITTIGGSVFAIQAGPGIQRILVTEDQQ